MKPVAVIGGGVTGLTAAFRLRSQGIPVVLYEAENRVGGVIQTIRQDGFLAESGPNSILETSPVISSLIRVLGLENRRVCSNPAAGNRYLVRGGKLVRLPDSLPSFLTTRLFSPAAKLNLLWEPFIPPSPPDREESVEQFVLRRLGREFLDYAINPLVGGVYAGNPAKLSVKHAFPKLHGLEQRYRSLIAGQFLGARERKRRAETSRQNANKLSFDKGLQVLTDELRSRLGASVRLGRRVHSLLKTGQGWNVFARFGQEEECGNYSAVVFTGTAQTLARLEILAEFAPDLSPMSGVYSPPIASVVLGFRREDVAHPLDGFGMLVPEVEKLNILGAIFSSSLFPNRAPAGHVLLTCYVGGARNPELALLNPDRMVEVVLHDLRKLLGATGRPAFEHHQFFPKSIPQYEVGYGRFKHLLDETESKCPGFFLAGQYRDGISLADCIVSGDNAAARIQTYLSSRNASESARGKELTAAA
jgi:oxygen-dependent protoporphyrinogen oxidase